MSVSRFHVTELEPARHNILSAVGLGMIDVETAELMLAEVDGQPETGVKGTRLLVLRALIARKHPLTTRGVRASGTVRAVSPGPQA